ncbi:hypothetical protein F5Y01DRAFT_319329 [Xylaria sp. FL0043]|nr:hypothetical protein F5Y01DRAFT_319329 [Xylaria sp. FL0043]
MSSSTATGISPEGYQGAGITLVIVTGLFVIARLIASWRTSGKFRIDDGISVLSVALIAGLVAVARITVEALNKPMLTTEYYSYILRLTQALNWISALALWCSKAPILFMFITLFGVRRALRFASYMMLAVLGIAVLVAAVITSATCTPGSGGLAPEFITKCSKVGATAGVALGFVSVLSDVIILILPLHVVWQLHLTAHKRLGLVVMFSSGILAIVASVIAVYYKWKAEKGSNVSLTNSMIGTLLENSIATIVGSIPSTYAFWQQMVLGTGLYTRLRSTLFSSRDSSVPRSQGNPFSNNIKNSDRRPSESSAKPLRTRNAQASSTEQVVADDENYHAVPPPSQIWAHDSTGVPLTHLKHSAPEQRSH